MIKSIPMAYAVIDNILVVLFLVGPVTFKSIFRLNVLNWRGSNLRVPNSMWVHSSSRNVAGEAPLTLWWWY